MKKLHTILLACALTSGFAWSQGTRYIDEVFDDVTVMSDMIYGINLTVITDPISPDTLTFDLYMPVGDTCTERPLAVVMHTGSFLPRGLFSPTGAKDDYANVQVCTRLAKRGYVAASMTHRLGWIPTAIQDTTRRKTIINAAYRAVQDLYTYIRFMNMTYTDQGNPYGIDTGRVAVFGIGTGGFVGFNAAVINSVEEIFIDKFTNLDTDTPFIDTLLVGDITGQQPGAINIPNHVGYNGKFHFVFGLDGAVGDSTWLEIGESVPLVCAGTVTHPTTPFGIDPETMAINCDLPVFVAGTDFFVVNIAGSACMIHKANEMGINDPLLEATFDDEVSDALRGNNFAQEHLWAINLPGPQAGPWEYWDSTFWKMVPCPLPDCENIHEAGIATNPDMSMEKANNYIDTALWFFAPRSYVVLNLDESACDVTSSIEILDKDAVGFNVMPNPATDMIRLQSAPGHVIRSVSMYDLLGKKAYTAKGIFTTNHEIGIREMQPGMYVIRADFDKGFVSEKVIIE